MRYEVVASMDDRCQIRQYNCFARSIEDEIGIDCSADGHVLFDLDGVFHLYDLNGEETVKALREIKFNSDVRLHCVRSENRGWYPYLKDYKSFSWVLYGTDSVLTDVEQASVERVLNRLNEALKTIERGMS